MKRLLCFITLIGGLSQTTLAQTTDSLYTDSLSFIRSKRMSDADLAKKREGRFTTGLPDLSSDPVTGFGVGIRTNTYWNGTRANPLFAYTPYLIRLRANVAYYTTNARELTVGCSLLPRFPLAFQSGL
ncbi:DUF5982 domain-containing protein [Larkinella sp. C7]|uniref:DUF5982 domain-containing protein n=1 Tax=Larkinella sp. C7 TaxID=2576607 RepID=UPI001BB1F800|nr:DUF5982 domain-containing protein [Larkinella sp. C7]